MGIARRPRRYSRNGQAEDEKLKDKNTNKLLKFLNEEYDLDNFLDTDKIDMIIRDIKIANILTDDEYIRN
tara:strand:- start:137456 stop:137665 length:210 start_codon:yes stop_codon:yes gene_type:complete